MTDILQSNLTPSHDAVESRVGDETVILHLKSGTYFGLDAIGTRIWELLQQGMAASAICDRLQEEFEVEREVLEADARRFLTELEANDIVVRG
jgi:PqqD family protein of HPr-rel-A system